MFSFFRYNHWLKISFKSFSFNRKEVEVENEIYSLIANVNTWYATSKNGIWFFSRMTSAIFSHCSGVGSMPVGLWAQPWSSTNDPSGAAWRKMQTKQSNNHPDIYKVVHKYVEVQHEVPRRNTHPSTRNKKSMFKNDYLP